MQVEGNWKAAANLDLLLGNHHPPARLEKPILAAAPRNAVHAGAVMVEARNTANFRNSSYCGLQDKLAPSVRRNIVLYYREMLQRIPLWRSPTRQEEVGSIDAVMKTEPQDEDGMVDSSAASAMSHSAELHHAPLFRALGILTQVRDPSAVSATTQQAPWEFYVVRSVDDDECCLRALHAMTTVNGTVASSFVLVRDTAQLASPSARGSGQLSSDGYRTSSGAAPDVTLTGAGEVTPGTTAEEEEEAAARDGTRLSLYTRQVPQFTGLYPGMAVGVIGEPFQRSARGVLTGVLVREFVLPSRPVLPWRIDRPFPLMAGGGATEGFGGRGVRIHFCSGPFPRRDVAALLRTVTTQALNRGADVLIIGGPFIPPFTNEFERGLLPTLGVTFSEMMESFVDTLEEVLKRHYDTRPLHSHLKVVLVSHTQDVTQIPVLPTTMYAIADTEDIVVRSNPCRLSVNGVHIGVCNEDVVSGMREQMVERWPTEEGSLRRVIEAIINGRLYTPLYRFPVTTADVKYLPQLRIDFCPPQNELAATELPTPRQAGADGKTERQDEEQTRGQGSPQYSSHGWDALFHMTDTSPSNPAKTESKRLKLERLDGDAAAPFGNTADPVTPSRSLPSVEYLPHIVFLPSTRPKFAVVTHQREEVDGEDIDNPDSSSGVLVVNQEVWSARSSPKFQLRVAEVTIADTETVLRRGATATNGIACGVLNIYSA